jgi:hypothetical protein
VLSHSQIASPTEVSLAYMPDLPEVPRRAERDAHGRRRNDESSTKSPLAIHARRLAFATLALFTISCSYDDTVRKFTPADADARAREYLGLLSRRQTDSAMARMIGEMQDPATRQQVVNVIGILDGEHFDSIRVIGANTLNTADARRVNLTYELHSPNGWFEANVATFDSAGDWRVYGLHATTLPQSLESMQWFTLRGKSLMQYGWLLATLVCAMISLATAVFIGTRKGMPRRWGWVAMTLLGYGTFAMNWSSGEWSYNLLSVQLLGAGYTRAGPYAPYLFAFSIPLGSAMALQRYRRWKTQRVSPIVGVAVG